LIRGEDQQISALFNVAAIEVPASASRVRTCQSLNLSLSSVGCRHRRRPVSARLMPADFDVRGTGCAEPRAGVEGLISVCLAADPPSFEDVERDFPSSFARTACPTPRWPNEALPGPCQLEDHCGELQRVLSLWSYAPGILRIVGYALAWIQRRPLRKRPNASPRARLAGRPKVVRRCDSWRADAIHVGRRRRAQDQSVRAWMQAGAPLMGTLPDGTPGSSR